MAGCQGFVRRRTRARGSARREQPASLRCGGAGRSQPRPRPGATVGSTERPVIRLLAFGALGLYGVLRWGTLLSPAPTWRLLGLLALAIALAARGAVEGDRRRALVAACWRSRGAAVLAARRRAVALGGPRPDRGTATRSAQGLAGIAARARALQRDQPVGPGGDRARRGGAAARRRGDAGVRPAASGDARRAAVALPLIALAVVPSTLVRPALPYLAGRDAVALLAAFVVGRADPRAATARSRLPSPASPRVAGVASAPALDPHIPGGTMRRSPARCRQRISRALTGHSDTAHCTGRERGARSSMSRRSALTTGRRRTSTSSTGAVGCSGRGQPTIRSRASTEASWRAARRRSRSRSAGCRPAT